MNVKSYMITKEQIIHDMCMTYRHDYGLRKTDNEPPWTSGMTEQDAKMLYKTMEQIYNNNIEPIIDYYKEKENALKTSK
jgi:adenylate kinase family enzyme